MLLIDSDSNIDEVEEKLKRRGKKSGGHSKQNKESDSDNNNDLKISSDEAQIEYDLTGKFLYSNLRI